MEFPVISSDLPYTLGIAINTSLHLFSINGLTLADAPFGQKILLRPSEFIGAISANCDRSSRALENFISAVIEKLKKGKW